MKKTILLVVLFFIHSICFSESIYFILNKDVIAKGGNIDSPEYEISKGTEISFDYDYKYYLNFSDDEYSFLVQGKYNDEKLKFNGDNLLFKDYQNFSIPFFESFWCMSYYYASLKNNDISIMKQKTEYMETDRGTGLIFNPLFLKFGNTYIGAQSSIRRDYEAISRILEYTKEMLVFEILTKDCGIKELDEKVYWEPVYTKLYEAKCPYKLFVLFDGDFAKIYINVISDDNYLFELARADKNTINQISNFVKTGKYDSTSITWPRHADGTCDYDDEIKPPKVQLSDNGFVAEEEEENATTSDPLSEEDDVKTVEDNVPVVKNTSSLSLVIIVASVVIVLLCIVIILILRRRNSLAPSFSRRPGIRRIFKNNL